MLDKTCTHTKYSIAKMVWWPLSKIDHEVIPETKGLQKDPFCRPNTIKSNGLGTDLL